MQACNKIYANEDFLFQVYVRELLILVIYNVNADEKIFFPLLHLKLESYLRALESLNLKELPMEFLLTWQRSPLSVRDRSLDGPPTTRL